MPPGVIKCIKEILLTYDLIAQLGTQVCKMVGIIFMLCFVFLKNNFPVVPIPKR